MLVRTTPDTSLLTCEYGISCIVRHVWWFLFLNLSRCLCGRMCQHKVKPFKTTSSFVLTGCIHHATLKIFITTIHTFLHIFLAKEDF